MRTNLLESSGVGVRMNPHATLQFGKSPAFKQAYPTRTGKENGSSEGGRMPSWGILVGAVIACWFGQYKIAFWATVFNTLSGGMMVAAIVRDPSWHTARRSRYLVLLEADGDDEEEITSFVMTKVVLIMVGALLGRYFGKWAGYF